MGGTHEHYTRRRRFSLYYHCLAYLFLAYAGGLAFAQDTPYFWGLAGHPSTYSGSSGVSCGLAIAPSCITSTGSTCVTGVAPGTNCRCNYESCSTGDPIGYVTLTGYGCADPANEVFWESQSAIPGQCADDCSHKPNSYYSLQGEGCICEFGYYDQLGQCVEPQCPDNEIDVPDGNGSYDCECQTGFYRDAGTGACGPPLCPEGMSEYTEEGVSGYLCQCDNVNHTVLTDNGGNPYCGFEKPDACKQNPNDSACQNPPDNDDDGIPDFNDPDDDNDGDPDITDPDDDDDGIPDTEDPDQRDNDDDGLPDSIDGDDDNDGIPDSNDTNDPDSVDSDDDGIPNAQDNDDDNDGLTDDVDNDDDGDGIEDFEDPDSDDYDGQTCIGNCQDDNGDGGDGENGGEGGDGEGGEGDQECDPSTEQCGGSADASGDCEIAPNCSGDAIGCAMISQQWQLSCQAHEYATGDYDPTADGYEGPDTVVSETITTESHTLDESGFGFGSTCPPDEVEVIDGQTVTLSYQSICDTAGLIGNILIFFASVLALLIIFA